MSPCHRIGLEPVRRVVRIAHHSNLPWEDEWTGCDNSPMASPYAEHVGTADPVDVLRSSLERYHRAIARLAPSRWDEPWSPGKWTVRQILLHVTQWEMIFGVRLRCGLALPPYTVQPLSQDPFMDIEGPAVDGPTAFAAFDGMRRMNIALVASLTDAQRKTPVIHPERGAIDANDLVMTLAGHGVHHLKQLESTR
jgi:hypothetical protein